ncbi:MAG TPA: hypothetical protein VLD86_10520 [Ilumatobacteraceae bacterium]|nr:hypothetical protein [Ilumatobacteraceae bacterium]
MVATPTQQELMAAHCWEAEDHVPRQRAMTDFRRGLRYHQARWREAHGHPIGSQPIAPRPGRDPDRLVGSRLPLAYAQDTGANFITAPARDAAKARTSMIERHQSFDRQRLWADLLWAPAMCFNLFGDLAADLTLADRAVHTWWPDVPGTVSEVRFAHSPGRLDPAYLGNLVDLDAAFVLDVGDGSRGIVGVITAYHNVNRPQAPKPSRLPRYREITERSGVFRADAMPAVNGTHLIHIWLDQQLVHSMLQHATDNWSWGRLIVVHPAGNSDFADACTQYRALLTDTSTFASTTIEALLAADVLPATTIAAFRDRYLPG